MQVQITHENEILLQLLHMPVTLGAWQHGLLTGFAGFRISFRFIIYLLLLLKLLLKAVFSFSLK